jgi:plasmid stabilization system protein ParE
MVQTITWSPGALGDFSQIISYLKEKWTDREADNFAECVDKKLALLRRHPRLGSIRSKKANIYKTLVHKRLF